MISVSLPSFTYVYDTDLLPILDFIMTGELTVTGIVIEPES